MRVVVFGAGGAIGGRVVAEARSRGHEVTAVHRTPPASVDDGVRAVRGDARAPRSILREAAPDAVISAVGAGATGPSPDLDVYVDAANALIAALRELGDDAPRLIAVGGAGSLQAAPGVLVVDTPRFPPQFREAALAQARALDVYRTVEDVRWTYVSPAALIEPGARTGEYRTGGDELLVDADGRSRITTEDYAAALIDEFERPQAIGRRMTVAS